MNISRVLETVLIFVVVELSAEICEVLETVTLFAFLFHAPGRVECTALERAECAFFSSFFCVPKHEFRKFSVLLLLAFSAFVNKNMFIQHGHALGLWVVVLEVEA